MAAQWPPPIGLSTVNVPRKEVVLPVYASIHINAPARKIFDTLLRVSEYGQWNTFCPEVTVQMQPHQEDTEPQFDTLQNGTSFIFHVVMNSAKPHSKTATGLKVSDVSTPDQPSSYISQELLNDDPAFTANLQKVYRIAWKSEGGFVARGLKSERFHEVIVVGDDECEVRTWECMGGMLAHTVKWMYKQTLMDKFKLWCEDLKQYCEQKPAQ